MKALFSSQEEYFSLRWISGMLVISDKAEGLSDHFGEAYRGAGRAIP